MQANPSSSSLKLYLISLFCFLLYGMQKFSVDGSEDPKEEMVEATFTFPEFDYMESTKTEVAYKEWEAACLQTPNCLGLEPLVKLKCVRKCMSPSCYHDLYGFDELEEGEIDIRFESFKGCFAQRIHKRRL